VEAPEARAAERGRRLARVVRSGQVRQPPATKDWITSPVAYADLMLVLVNADGAAAVVFGKVGAEGAEVPYRFRYQSADGKTTKTGEGKLFERRVAGGGYDPAGLELKAGPICLKWSMGGQSSGWVYYAPEAVKVHLANARDFEDKVEDVRGRKEEYKALDLKRFMQK
jgi:hypothetical protein